MATAQQRAQWLGTSVLVAASLLLGGLLVRTALLQKGVKTEQEEALERQHNAIVPVMGNRGEIRSSDGTTMAASVRMYNLFADPAYILDPEGKLNALDGPEVEKAKRILVERLSPLVNKPVDELQFYLETNVRYESGRPRRFLWLAREVDESFYNNFAALKKKLKEEAKDLRVQASKIKDEKERETKQAEARVLHHAFDGVGFVKSIRRTYPLGSLGGTIIGFANNYEGVDGMEHQLDALLKGRPGKMLVIKDASRRNLMIQEEGYEQPDHGRTVWLTINTVIQSLAEEELGKAIKEYNAQGGCAIVMDTQTGRILAMTNWPPFDPNKYKEQPEDTRRNRSITDPYEPGSIFKPFVMAWALEKKVIKPTDVINCHGGHWTDPTGRAVTDVHGYGLLPVDMVLVKSSNIGMAQIGWKCGIPTLHEGVTKFGFGTRTGVELPGDQKGLVTPLPRWNNFTLTSVSFGYEVAATPLQLVRAFSTFGNGGYLVTPRIMSAVEEEPGKAVPWTELAGAPIDKQVISTKTAEQMRIIMAGVYAKGGTAQKAASKIYNLYGKTGTAHIAGRSRGEDARGYGATEYNSSFLAGGPMSAPRLSAIVTIHKPDRSLGHFGGVVAAPAATNLVERSLQYLQVQPDKAPEPAKPVRGPRVN